jgi:methionine-rich copper-binding protein CopC
MDKQPTDSFTVLPHIYDIINLNTYNDSVFTSEDDDFFRGENMYVKFQVADINNGNAIVNDAIAEAYLVSPPGGRASLTEMSGNEPGWYYFSLKPIPLTHDFKGASQIFTIAFNFERTGGGSAIVNIIIRNNIPTMQVIPDKTIPVIGSEEITLGNYANDLEDSDDLLQYVVEQTDSSIADLTLDGDKLKIKPKQVGSTTIRVIVTDLDGDSAETSFSVNVTAGPGPDVREETPEQHLMVEKIRLPFDESVAAGETAVFTFHLNNDGDFDNDDIKITATIIEIPNARKTTGPFRLDKGEEITKQLAIDIPEDVEPGTYTLKMVATGDDGQIKRIKYRFLRITE